MNNLMTVHTLGPQLIALLGLPKHCTSFELRCAVDEIVTVKCEYHPEESDGIDKVLAEYELVPRAKPAAAPSHRADEIGFDAWMRERTEAAHQDMMTKVRVDSLRIKIKVSTRAFSESIVAFGQSLRRQDVERSMRDATDALGSLGEAMRRNEMALAINSKKYATDGMLYPGVRLVGEGGPELRI